MVLFNYSTKELTAKVVYYGPALCGKTTNLQWIHEKLPIKNKGKMLSLATETDRTLFFDFLPIEIGAIRGMKTRIQLYTVPGQVFYNATRRMVLKGADAVVFVCDSQEAVLEADLESYGNLGQNLVANDIDPDDIPVVLQYNKRDLPNALPLEILNERLNERGFPFYEAVAVKGVGVEETLKAITKLVFKSLSSRYGDVGSGSGVGRSPLPRVSSPPREAPPALREASAPPIAFSSKELFIDSSPAPPAPRLVETPPPAGRAGVAASERPLPHRPPATPSPWPADRLASGPRAEPPRPSVEPTLPAPMRHAEATPQRPHEHSPQSTLISEPGEAEDLRRRIGGAPAGPPPDEPEELDLEEIDELDAIVPESLADREPEPSETRAPVRPSTLEPSPQAQQKRTGTAELEVPLEISVAPGTTRIYLRLKLTIDLKPR